MSGIDRQTFVRHLLDLYLRLPHTAARRPSPSDRRLAQLLFDRRLSLDLTRAALLLALARRTKRPKSAPPLPPIRSLYYFLPVIEELLTSQPDPAYLHHIIQRYGYLLARPRGQI